MSSNAPSRRSSPISSTDPTASAALARRYGEGLVLGLTIEQINDWPVAIAKVTAEDIKRVANQHLDIRQLP